MILIVDDNPVNILLMTTLATEACGEEADARGFESPQEALDLCDTAAPDLVFVDYMMPQIDGHAFIERLRSKPNCQSVPIVMVTAADEPWVRQRAFELGATEFLAKPIDNLEFRLRARNLLQLRRATTHLEAQVRQAVAALEASEAEMMETIAQAAELRDPETGMHTRRVGLYAHLIASHLGVQEPYLSDLLKAAPMHDLGKIGIPDAILLKPGKLTEEEWAVMRLHPSIGARIAGKCSSPVMRLAAEISMSHHEKYGGEGYPLGLAGDAIPLSGRIVAVADVFDALTTKRPYKDPWTPESAREWMKENVGPHFCPKCAGAFFARWDDALAIMANFAD